jgi:BASS family bile acid:Na+ symporter
MAHPSYSFIDVLLSGILALMMLGVGLSLTSIHFKNLFLFPKPLFISLTSQILILPVIAFTVSYFSDMALPFKVGLIILACCPGGTTSGVLTYLKEMLLCQSPLHH